MQSKWCGGKQLRGDARVLAGRWNIGKARQFAEVLRQFAESLELKALNANDVDLADCHRFWFGILSVPFVFKSLSRFLNPKFLHTIANGFLVHSQSAGRGGLVPIIFVQRFQ